MNGRDAFIAGNVVLIMLMLGFSWMTLDGAKGVLEAGACFSYQCTPTFSGSVIVIGVTGLMLVVQTAALYLLIDNIRKALKA